MKTTDKFKDTGPVFAAQYMYVFQPADKANPYDEGTWAHKAFNAEMKKLENEDRT